MQKRPTYNERSAVLFWKTGKEAWNHVRDNKCKSWVIGGVRVPQHQYKFQY